MISCCFEVLPTIVFECHFEERQDKRRVQITCFYAQWKKTLCADVKHDSDATTSNVADVVADVRWRSVRLAMAIHLPLYPR